MQYNALSGFMTPVKRKAFFSFHYDDIMRVNNVRNAWKINHPDSSLMRSFYDSSLWESKKLEGPEAVKRLIREGVENASAICVLIGSQTWSRQWVRYEIARAIIDGRGLLAVHINGLAHHVSRRPDSFGPNPLSYMAVGKAQGMGLLSFPQYHLYERTTNGWDRYADHTHAVTLPSWLPDPAPGYVSPLDRAAISYDYVANNGHQNIGAWVDTAAKAAGR